MEAKAQALRNAFKEAYNNNNKLVDMQESKIKDSTSKTVEAPSKDQGPRYPYGLKLRFENEQIKKLPKLKQLTVGDKVSINAIGEVCSISTNEEHGHDDRYTVEIQIKKLNCES